MAVTATLAAPVHGRLDTPDPVLLRRLLRVDRVRAVLAVAALVLAGAALRADPPACSAYSRAGWRWAAVGGGGARTLANCTHKVPSTPPTPRHPDQR